MIKHNKIKFVGSNSIRKTKVFIMVLLIASFMLIMSLILTLGKNGFQDANKLYGINKKLIIVIPISSARLSIASLLLQHLSIYSLADNSALGLGNINLTVSLSSLFIVDFNSVYSANNYLNIYPLLFIIFSILPCSLIFLFS